MPLNIGLFINNTFKHEGYAIRRNVDRMRNVAGMQVSATDESGLCQKMINVPEENRQKVFDMVKEEFIKEKGVTNVDNVNRSSVYHDYQISINKDDRLNGTWSMQQYEEQYVKAFDVAVRASNPKWKPGQCFDISVLEGITRESVESILIQRGNTLARKRIDCAV